nr:HEPN domain-containing protein [Aeropyrum camini]
MVLDCEEADRWLRQARYTLESVRSDYDGGFYSWACFKANQAAEYSLKAVLSWWGGVFRPRPYGPVEEGEEPLPGP